MVFDFTRSLENFKPRSNDRNEPTQHIATLLGATCSVRLATVLRCVATFWMLLTKISPFSNLSQHISQHGGQTHTTCCTEPTKFRYVALACCDRLTGGFFLVNFTFNGKCAKLTTVDHRATKKKIY